MATWILTLLLLVSPPWRVPARESEAAGRARYLDIATDIAFVVSDADESPLFGGKLARERTGALVVAVGYMESGWRLDVDNGTTLGDHGRACTSWQLQRSRAECAKLLADRRAAVREALHAMRLSAAACHGLIQDMLRAYASGRCDAGEEESRTRVQLAQRLFAAHPPPAPASLIVAARAL